MVVDLGASDGVSQSCTYPLFSSGNWSGLAVEADGKKFSKLAANYREFAGARLARTLISPINVKSILQGADVAEDFDVLNIDLDSFDLQVLRELFSGGFKPKIITMEINEKIPPGVFFEVEYRPNTWWQGDHFYGCSLSAAHHVLSQAGYILTSLEFNNAFFVVSHHLPPTLSQPSVGEAYEAGYAGRPNRKTLFPWNEDVDHWIAAQPAQVVEEIKIRFLKYQGQYRVSLEP